jgi:L,D-transpeptidase ErfK/SrfK
MIIILLTALILGLTPPCMAWDETSFDQKKTIAHPYMLPNGTRDFHTQTVIGSPRTYTVQHKDTLLDIARFFDLGYNEITAAHPDVDPWIPKAGSTLSIPTSWILPQSRFKGMVVNIPEMRMYYYPPEDKRIDQPVVLTYPVGLGREEWPTPRTPFRIRGKTANPTWVIPQSIKEERIKEKGWSENSIPGGVAENPLGKYRLELSLSQASGAYAIHGTNNPWAVGRLVTHGCIRLYPEDIARFFDIVRVGSPGELTYQPVKIGMQHGRVYIEAHTDIYNFVPDLWGEAQKVVQNSGWAPLVDPLLLTKALRDQSGIPVDVTKKGAALSAPQYSIQESVGIEYGD